MCIRDSMTIAPFVDDPEDNRQYFRDIKQLSVDIAQKNIDNVSKMCIRDSCSHLRQRQLFIYEGAQSSFKQRA